MGRKEKRNHDIGAAIIDLRFYAADNGPDAEPDERSTSDADADDASFTWRSSSVPDMDVGRRSGALVVAAGGDFVAEQPKAEDMDSMYACDTPVGNVAVERDASCRGGPVELVDFTVIGVGTLFVVVVLVAVVAAAYIRTPLPSVVTCAVLAKDTSEALPALDAPLLSSERQDA